MRIIAAIFALSLFSGAHAQGIDETNEPQSFALHDGTTGSPIKGPDGKTLSYPDINACWAASRVMFAATPLDTVTLKYRCVQATVLTFRRTCEGVPKPPAETFVIIDPNGVKYTFPESEDPPQPGIRVLPEGGTEYTIAEAGGLRVQELANGDWVTEIEVLVNTNVYPTCWQWQWQPQPEPLALLDSKGLPFASTAADWSVPEVDACGMDGDGSSGDPTWATHIPPKVCPSP